VDDPSETDTVHGYSKSSMPALGLAGARDRVRRHRHKPALHAEDGIGSDRWSAEPSEQFWAVLSLIIWTLIIVTTVKYVSVAMSIDNDGEGGILALMSLIGSDGTLAQPSSPSACSARR